MQTEIEFPQKIKPIDAHKKAEMYAILESTKNWITYKTMKLNSVSFTDREARLIAASSNGEIISGQKGYRLTKYATVDEVKHASNWLESAAAEMISRSYDIRNAFRKYRDKR